ncbi:MAG: hypothetical protein CMM35_09050 [Rhodospirillaceae bacterium]|nr:hypothetical protein [Rhodospirillaceae bacterium]
MPHEFNSDSEYGSKIFRNLFDHGLDFVLNRLIKRAKKRNLNLSTAEISDKSLLSFKSLATDG